MVYLSSRRRGGRDWIVFHNTEPVEDLRQAAPELRAIDLERPLVGLLTNVAWDAQLHYPANAFPDMLDWIVLTVRWFGDRPDLQLLIRVHPAELSGDIRLASGWWTSSAGYSPSCRRTSLWSRRRAR